MDSNWFKELFIDEAEAALNANGGSGGSVSDEQIDTAVSDYFEENPIPTPTAKIENNVLVIE